MTEALVDELDRILRSDEVIAPPPRFTANVMAAVRTSAQRPSIGTPWWSFVQQFAASAGILAAGFVVASQVDAPGLGVGGAGLSMELASSAAVGLAALGVIYLQRLLSHQD